MIDLFRPFLLPQLSWGRSPAAAAGGWGSSEEAPDVCFFGASSFWFFRNDRATIACAKKGGSHRDSEPLRPPPQSSPKTIWGRELSISKFCDFTAPCGTGPD